MWLVSVTESTEGDGPLMTFDVVGVEIEVSRVEDVVGVDDEVEVEEEDEDELVELVELVLEVDELDTVCGGEFSIQENCYSQSKAISPRSSKPKEVVY